MILKKWIDGYRIYSTSNTSVIRWNFSPKQKLAILISNSSTLQGVVALSRTGKERDSEDSEIVFYENDQRDLP